MPGEFYLEVPWYRQTTGYYCGPAALEMVFDYYGPDVPQVETADVARTAPDGTYTTDMVRAAHFSNLSTSVGNEMPGSVQGYTARKLGYAALEYSGMTIDQLKFSVALGYPIIVLTTWHFRVAVGYSETHITFQDSAYGRMYNMSYASFDSDWDYSGHWALLVTPWKARLTAPSKKLVGSAFNVTATVTYPSPPPFSSSESPASQSTATLMLPNGMNLAVGQTLEKTIGNLTAGETKSVYWTVSASVLGSYVVGVEVEGLVAGSVPSLPSYPAPYSYTDRIGGYNQTSVDAVWDEAMPITSHDYDGLWHTEDFAITLTATDDISGVAEIYYKINGKPTQTVAVDGQPMITSESASNMLEFWSIDNAGNEETHHILGGIKLDKTVPTGSVIINDGDTYANAYAVSHSATLTLTAADVTSGVFQVRLSDDGLWDTEAWVTASITKTWALPTGDGTKTVYYQVKDNAGLISSAYSDTIILDTKSPTVSMTYPVSGFRSSTVTVTWIGSDETSGISNYEIRLDGGEWVDVGTDTSYTFTGVADGTHEFHFAAIDTAGNIVERPYVFVVDTSPLQGPGYTEEAVLAAVFVIVVLAIAYAVMKRRKK